MMQRPTISIGIIILIFLSFTFLESRSIQSKGNGIGRKCFCHSRCPHGFACLQNECHPCNCTQQSQCSMLNESVICDCSGSGFTGINCETKEGPCGTGWIENNGSCYFFSTLELTWFAAKNYCLAEGSYLVEIEDVLDNEFISTKPGAWIGLTDIDNEGIFVWSTGTEPTFTRVGDNDPDYDCFYHFDTFWYSSFCYNFFPFICERQLEAT